MESKCPCCGVIVMVLAKGTIECFKCPFTCAQKDLPRIAAAMDLARAAVLRESCSENNGDIFEVLAVQKLYVERCKRVIEVFGGE